MLSVSGWDFWGVCAGQSWISDPCGILSSSGSSVILWWLPISCAKWHHWASFFFFSCSSLFKCAWFDEELGLFSGTENKKGMTWFWYEHFCVHLMFSIISSQASPQNHMHICCTYHLLWVLISAIIYKSQRPSTGKCLYSKVSATETQEKQRLY